MKNGPQEETTPFSSNAERLAMREWFGLLLGLLVLGAVAGPIWKSLERFEPSADYRLPYELSEDYWLFDRFCGEVDGSEKSFVFGDSFVWGQYVRKDETLSLFLNQNAGSERFVNAGLDGAHPLALEGLLEHYCTGLSGREIILHLNLLWMSSPQADLQLERGLQFNHPRLVSQFTQTIPSYESPISKRLGIVLARHVPFMDLSRHIGAAYYSNADLHHWTLEHPYINPFRQITLTLPESDDSPHSNAQAWNVEGGGRHSLPWVDVEGSLQWQAFQRLVSNLQARGNRLFVLVGPLNEHMLEPANLEVFRGILSHVESWLEDRNLPFYAPPVLPSHLYADLSHPLGDGYAILAQELWQRLPG